jgi:hypothetical protein
MTKAKNQIIPPEKVALYDKLVKSIPDLERKGASTPYTSLNGHMFSFMAPDGSLGLRLSPEARETFLKEFETTLCRAHGTVLKEYVVVPDKLLKNTRALKVYFASSYAYVKALKPKPQRKSSRAGKRRTP